MVSGAQAACRSGHCHTNTELKVENGAAVYQKKKERNVVGHLNERKLERWLLHQDSENVQMKLQLDTNRGSCSNVYVRVRATKKKRKRKSTSRV